MRTFIWLTGIAAAALLVAACDHNSSNSSSSPGQTSAVDTVAGVIATTSETAEPVGIDTAALAPQDTAEPSVI